MFKTIGSDMELFAMDKKKNHVALCGLIGGTKEEPKKLDFLGEGFMIQEDNVAFEFNIPICTTAAGFVNVFKVMRNQYKGILKELGYLPSRESSVSFNPEQLKHPQALVFGCEPDYNAWSMFENPKPYSDNENLRTAGGHIHVGTNSDLVTTAHMMDLYLGVPSIILDDTPASIERRKLYGKAGAVRPKPYGLEYRTLSNFWHFSDELVRWVYNRTRQACNEQPELSFEVEEAIQTCINTGDKKIAQELINTFHIPMPQSFVPFPAV